MSVLNKEELKEKAFIEAIAYLNQRVWILESQIQEMTDRNFLSDSTGHTALASCLEHIKKDTFDIEVVDMLRDMYQNSIISKNVDLMRQDARI